MEFGRYIVNEDMEKTKGAQNIVNIARNYDGTFAITKDGVIANGKSIMGLINLGLKNGDEVIIELESNKEEKDFPLLLKDLGLIS